MASIPWTGTDKQNSTPSSQNMEAVCLLLFKLNMKRPSLFVAVSQESTMAFRDETLDVDAAMVVVKKQTGFEYNNRLNCLCFVN
jgi:hypothetical protein